MLSSQLRDVLPMDAVLNGLVAIDPITEGKLAWTPILIILAKVLIVFVLGLVGTMLMVWFERKVVSGMQNRVGPNKAGPFGLLQTLADGIKALLQGDDPPAQIGLTAIVYRLAPFLMPSSRPFSIWAVLPLGGDFTDGNDGSMVTIFGQVTRVQLADPPVGILLVLAMYAASRSTA